MSDQQFLDDLARNPELELSKYLNTKLQEKYDRGDIDFRLSKSLMLFNLTKENVKARDMMAYFFYGVMALCFLSIAIQGALP